MPSRRQSRQTASRYRAKSLPPHTRRRLGGRQPLWGMGVTSRMVVTCSPAVARARMADSRPEPGPFTRTSTVRIPTSRARLAAAPAACPAAKGVPLREPLKPTAPELDQATTLPFTSVTVTSVLLNDAWMCTMPAGTCFFSRFLRNSFLRAGLAVGWAAAWALSSFGALATRFLLYPFLPTTFFFRAAVWRRGPLGVRGLVGVRGRRPGGPRRWRWPR